MNNPETYLNLLEAIQAHVAEMNGSDRYARDWVLVCGIDDIHHTDNVSNELRLERSPGTTAYAVTGLLGWALDCYTSEGIDD